MAGVSVAILDRCSNWDRCRGKHTVFRIRVRIGECAEIVARRYSEFAALDAYLRPIMRPLPELPPRGTLKKLLPSFLDVREYRLDRLIISMVEHDPQLNNPQLQMFLDVKRSQLHVLRPIVITAEACARLSSMTSSEGFRPKWLPRPDSTSMDLLALPSRPACLEEAFRSDCLSTVPGDLKLDSLPTLLPSPATTTEASSEQKAAVLAIIPNPTFSGSWLLKAVEGDVDQLMKIMKWPWIIRKASASGNYCVNVVKANISQSGICIQIENIYPAPVGTRRVVLQVDGVERDTNFNGTPLKMLSHWEGSILMTECRGNGLSKIKRYLQDGNMVVEQVLSSGKTVKQVFVPCQHAS